MGRGRAKAKQTKVARQLKYNSGGTDLSRLAEELGVSSDSGPNGDRRSDNEPDDPYAAYVDDYDDEDAEQDGPDEHRRHA